MKDRMNQIPDGSLCYNIMLFEPMGEYKLVEKLEMEEQKRNENKIQNKDQKPDQAEEKASQKPTSDMNGLAQPKKKKPVFEDVDF